MITNGFLPRFTIIEVTSPTPYLKRDYAIVQPPLDLVMELANLCGICLGRQAQNLVHNVETEKSAADFLYEFSKFCTDKKNSANDDSLETLWSRAHMKALKYAAVIAVGINPINPVITLKLAREATGIMFNDVNFLINKFRNDEVGEAVSGASENSQYKELCRLIYQFRSKTFDHWKTYGVTEEMYKAGVIPLSALQRKSILLQPFKLDRIGATNAFHKQIKSLIDAGDIQEIGKLQMKAQFGTTAKAFVVTNPNAFMLQATGKASLDAS
jgi:hypothetical protein